MWYIHFALIILFDLTLASDMVVLYRSDAFSILVLSTKIRYSSVLKKSFVFQNIFFKVKVLKTFKISTDSHIKTCRSHKRTLKIPSTVFPLALKWNLWKKANTNFAVKLAERSNHSFLLSIWWITFFKHLHFFHLYHFLIRVMEFTVRSSQAAILVLNRWNCTDLLNFPCQYR